MPPTPSARYGTSPCVNAAARCESRPWPSRAPDERLVGVPARILGPPGPEGVLHRLNRSRELPSPRDHAPERGQCPPGKTTESERPTRSLPAGTAPRVARRLCSHQACLHRYLWSASAVSWVRKRPCRVRSNVPAGGRGDGRDAERPRRRRVEDCCRNNCNSVVLKRSLATLARWTTGADGLRASRERMVLRPFGHSRAICARCGRMSAEYRGLERRPCTPDGRFQQRLLCFGTGPRECTVSCCTA